MKLTKLAAVKKLRGFDHSFLTPEGVKALVEPFGFDPKEFIYKTRDTRSQFKGLYVPGVKEGDWVEGADADAVAEKLCYKLKVRYTPMGGRGSALRECCDRLMTSLQKEGQ